MDDAGAALRVEPGAPDPQHLGGQAGRGVVPAVGDDQQPVRRGVQRVEDPQAERRRAVRVREQGVGAPRGPQRGVLGGERLQQVVCGEGGGERAAPLLAGAGGGEAVVQDGGDPPPAAQVRPGRTPGGGAQRAGQLGAAPHPVLDGQAEDVPGQPGQRHPGEVGADGVGAVAARGLLQAQLFQPGHLRRDLLQERAPVDAVPGGEALGDAVRQLVEGGLLVVGAAPGVQQRGRVGGLSGRAEQEGAELLGGRGEVGVPQGGLQPGAVLDGVERGVGPGGDPVPDDRAGAPVVDPGSPQGADQPVDARRREQGEPARDQPALGGALSAGGLAGALQQAPDDQGRVVVVDVERQRGRVQVAVVAEDVGVQEVQREALLAGLGVELALAGGGDRRVDEEQDVVGCDEVAERFVGGHRCPSPRSMSRPAGEWGRELRIIA